MNTYLNEEYADDLAAVFIDMLGVSEEINNAKNRNDAEKIASKIESFYKNFDYQIEPEGNFKKESFNFSDCKTLFFDFDKNNFSLALTHLEIIAQSQLDCVKQGIFIRGGISFGYRFKHDDLFISQAFVESAKLEASISYPIIGISNKMTAILKKTIKYPLIIKIGDIDNSLESNLKKVYFLNYLTGFKHISEYEKIKSYKDKYTENTYRAHYYFDEQRICFKNHKNQIEKALLSIDTGPVMRKYEFLKKYHNWAIDNYINDNIYIYPIDKELVSLFKSELSF